MSSKVLTSIQKSEDTRDNYYYVMHKDDIRMQQYILNPVVFTEKNNVNTLYYHQDMKSSHTNNFKKVIIKEVNYHVKIKH